MGKHILSLFTCMASLLFSGHVVETKPIEENKTEYVQSVNKANTGPGSVCVDEIKVNPSKDYWDKDFVPYEYWDVKTSGKVGLHKVIDLPVLPNEINSYIFLFIFDGNILGDKPESQQYYPQFKLEISMSDSRGAPFYLLNYDLGTKNSTTSFYDFIKNVPAQEGSGPGDISMASLYGYNEDTNETVIRLGFHNDQALKFNYIDLTYGDKMSTTIVKAAHFYHSYTRYDNIYTNAHNIERLVSNCSGNEFIPVSSDNLDLTFEYQQAPTLSYILQSFLAYDDETDVYTEIEVTSNPGGYHPLSAVGDYAVKLQTSDKYDNATLLTLNIKIRDTTGPEFRNNGNYSFKYYDLNIEKTLLSYMDCYDPSGINEIKLSETEEELHKVGVHNVEVTATDIYDNPTTKTFEVTVIDDKAPVFDGPTNIKISMNTPYLINDIIDMFAATDEVDGECEINVISDDYHSGNNSRKIGIYEIVMGAVDKSHNLSYFTTKVNVVDDDGPALFMKQGSLIIEEGSKISNLDLARSLQEQGFLPSDKEYVTAFRIEGFEIDGKNPLGTFNLRLQCNTREGDFDIADIEVRIVEKMQSTIENEENNKYSSNAFIAFFQRMFDSIKKFFVSIFG